MTLKARQIAAAIEPGQFVHMKVPGMEAHILRRPFSVYARDGEAGTLEILYQAVGFGSAHMTELQADGPFAGDVELVGPVGRIWQPPADVRRALLVGGGVGAAPLFMLAESLVNAGVRTDVVLGAQTQAALSCRERYEALLAAAPACDDAPRCATDDGSFGREGFCTSLVEEALADAKAAGEPYDYLAVCGPEPHEDRSRHGRRGRGALRGVDGTPHGLWHRSLPVLRGRHHRRQAACVRGRPRVRRPEGGVVMTRFDAEQPVGAGGAGCPPVAQTVLGLHGQSTGLSGACGTRLVEGTPRRPLATSVRMAVNLGGLEMKNPVTVASGTFAAGREYGDFVDVASLGAVTTKGVSLNGWEGNESPRIAETPSGMLNSIGLQNPGVAHLKEHDLPWLQARGATVIVNVSGHSFDEYVQVIEALEDAPVDAYEVNISCPNVDAGGMTIGTSAASVEKVVSRCRAATKRPLVVKLTPNVTDVTEIARAAEAAGADALSLINTILGMAIDAERRRPQLARVVGGLSGPAVKPVALRMVWECAKAVQVPLLGMGGIATAADAVEFLLAGATAVAVGTANFANPTATVEVIDGIAQYCERHGVHDVNELIGALEC